MKGLGRRRADSGDGWFASSTQCRACAAASNSARLAAPARPTAGTRAAASPQPNALITASVSASHPQAGMAGRLALLHRQHGVEQQHALRAPRRQAAARPAGDGVPRSRASSLKMLRRLGGSAHARRTENARPSAWPRPWYGSWPRITTRTCARRRQSSARNGSAGIDRRAGRPTLPRRSRPAPGRRAADAAVDQRLPAGAHALERRRQRLAQAVVGQRRPARSSRTARPAPRPGSAARMNASPTRKACTPAARMRCTSARREDAALGDQQPIGRHVAAAGRAWCRATTSKVRRLRLLMPTSGVFSRSARSSSAPSCTSTSTAMPSACAQRLEVAPSARRRGGDDQQDAVGAHRARLRRPGTRRR